VKRRTNDINQEVQQLLPPGSCKYELSIRGSKKLIDPNGYSYNIKAVNQNIGVTYWQCSIRPKKNPCRASLIEKADGALVIGRHTHNHSVTPGAAISSRVVAAVKELAAYNVYKPAQMIVKDVIDREVICAGEGTDLISQNQAFLPPMRSLIRSANRYRRSLRPNEPTDLEFDLEHKHLPPDFFRVDLRVDYGRHLIFATDEQITALTHAESWFADVTPTMCRAPFKQLFTLTAFVGHAQENGTVQNIKLVPLLYVLMSTTRNSMAYEAILGELLSILPQPPVVQKIAGVLDKDLWKAFSRTMQHVKVRVCSNHYMRAVCKKVSQLNLMDLQDQINIRTLIHQYMALPFLPAPDIPEAFRVLQSKCKSGPLLTFSRYIQRTWVSNKNLPISNWSSFGEVVRLDSDVSDWQTKLSARRNEIRARIPFYLLVSVLYEETKTLSQACLVDDIRLKMRPLRGINLGLVWNRYHEMAERRCPYDLLCECSLIMDNTIISLLSS